MTAQLGDYLGSTAQDPLRLATLAAMGTTDRDARLGEAATALAGITPEAWIAFATRNRVEPIVAHALLDMDGPAAAGGRASEIHSTAHARTTALLGELDEVAARLAREGIALVALKNAGIAQGVFPCAACCPMGDVDALVPRRRFVDAHRLMLETGFELASRAPEVDPADLDHGLSSGGTEYHKAINGQGIWFELQWRPVAGRWIRADQEPDGDILIERSTCIPGHAVRILAPEDNMLQVCLHTAKHTYVRAPGLRLHTDVDRLATYTPPDWPRLVSAAKTHAVTTPVYFSLSMAQALLGARVPDPVIEALAPPRWKREVVSTWLRRLDVFEPDGRKLGRVGMLGFHALLYDSVVGLLASVLGTTPAQLAAPYEYPRHVMRGCSRMYDLATRFQR